MYSLIGLAWIILIILILSLDSVRIRSNIISLHEQLRRRHKKKKKEQEDQLSISEKANLGSDHSLPGDYFMSINCSSGYGSTIIHDTTKKEEEIIRDQENNEQEDGAELPPQHTKKIQTLED